MTSCSQSTKIILPPAAASQSRPMPRMRAPPTTHADKDRARARYREAYHKVAATVILAAAATDNKWRRAAINELSDSLVSYC